jgi:hypothetical protein
LSEAEEEVQRFDWAAEEDLIHSAAEVEEVTDTLTLVHRQLVLGEVVVEHLSLRVNELVDLAVRLRACQHSLAEVVL